MYIFDLLFQYGVFISLPIGVRNFSVSFSIPAIKGPNVNTLLNVLFYELQDDLCNLNYMPGSHIAPLNTIAPLIQSLTDGSVNVCAK